MSFFKELRRRNVFRVGFAYVVIAWLIAQVADLVFDNIEAPEWLMPALLFLLAAGFLLALFFAWAFELTPDGIKKEKEVDRSQSITPRTGRKLDFIIFGLMAVALVYFVWESRFQTGPDRVSQPVEEVLQQTVVDEAVATAAKEASIAVLPFADLSAEGDQEYFADGISEELLNVLVRVEGLTVASRTSSFAFKGQTSNISQIAEELKVNHVLEGSVRKAGNRVRITAQLIDANTDRHLWSETFDRELVDIFAIQDEIANAIVDALRTELGVVDALPSVSVTADTKSIDAYEIYLQARALFLAREQLEEGIRLFELAVELDPGFARAWEGLGAIYGVVESWGITDRDYTSLSIEASQKALELNPDLSMPWATLGLTMLGSDPGGYAKKMEYFDRSIQNDAKNSSAFLWRGIAWAELGFMGRALEDTVKCLEIDSFYENCRRHRALFILMQGEVDQAMELFQQGVERGFTGTRRGFYPTIMEREGRLATALLVLTWGDNNFGFPLSEYLDALEFPDADHSRGLVKMLNWLESSGKDLTDWSYFLAAFGAYDLLDPVKWDTYLVWSDEFRGYRSSPYFKPVIRTSGLPEYWQEFGFPPICRPLGAEDFECD